MSTSARYLRVQFAILLILSSPRNLAIVCTSCSSPSLYATRPFCEKLYGNTWAMPCPSCSSCLGKSDPPTMPTVILSERDFIKAIMSGVTSPRGMVRVPSTSKRIKRRPISNAAHNS